VIVSFEALTVSLVRSTYGFTMFHASSSAEATFLGRQSAYGIGWVCKKARMHLTRIVEAIDGERPSDHRFMFDVFDEILSQVNVSELGKQIALFAGARW
jgi:hypothetical protein